MKRRPLSGNKARYVAAIIGLALAIGLGSTFGPWAIALYQLANPPDTDAAWNSKVGWRLCNGAIADWPAKPAPACWKLTLCDNEGGLSEAERGRLKQMMAATKCED